MESFQCQDTDVRSVFEPILFALAFSDAHGRYRVFVPGATGTGT